MKLNLKLRFKNKVVLFALLTAVVTFVYQILGIVGITVPISENQIIEWISTILNLLVIAGVITDPTTAGIKDTTQVMEYTEPRKE